MSASVWSADEVLARVLPILLDEADAFKLTASRRALSLLNSGDAGLSQVGKFLTVYPRDDCHAIQLASALDAATHDLRGPRIPSDRRFRSDSLVWYRFGSFTAGRHLQTPLGEIVPAVIDPSGVLVPDQRATRFAPPEWTVDPFQAAGLGVDGSQRSPLVAQRYLLGGALHVSPRGAVFVAADLLNGRRCILKQALAGALLNADGHDARDRLRHEARVLQAIAARGEQPPGADGDPFPSVYDLVEDDRGDLYLVLEDIVGLPLGAEVHARVAAGKPLATALLAEWGRQLTRMLDRIHQAGYVYRDLKSGNLIVTNDGRLRLVDFELAHPLGSNRTLYGRGTPGYMSPQQSRGLPPSTADDIYALGAVLYLLATGAEPSRAPDERNLLSRPIHLLNPACPAALADLIAACLAPDISNRVGSLAETDAALVGVTGSDALLASCKRQTTAGASTNDEADRWLAAARRFGDSLCAAAREVPPHPGLAWLSALPGGLHIPCRDINLGSAGIVLTLAELVDTFDDPHHRAVLAQAARWLKNASRPPGYHVPGLYVGEAGVGAALLRAAQVLGDDQLRTAAVERGHLIADLPHASPDLFNGTAGRLRFHLLLWDATGDRIHLTHAVQAADSLTATSKRTADGGVYWVAPSGFDRMTGRAFIGYAHGAAGIADALLDLFDATANERYRTLAAQSATWIAANAVPSLDDDSGLDWPVCAGDREGQGFWCHGAAGVGRFLLHAAETEVLPGAMQMVLRAARTVAQATRWASPAQCHGLSGNIEFLLDVHHATGLPDHLEWARTFGRLLDAFAIERDGHMQWQADTADHVVLDYLGGSAGVAACLLRLSAPESGRPTLLSRAGFHFRA